MTTLKKGTYDIIAVGRHGEHEVFLGRAKDEDKSVLPKAIVVLPEEVQVREVRLSRLFRRDSIDTDVRRACSGKSKTYRTARTTSSRSAPPSPRLATSSAPCSPPPRSTHSSGASCQCPSTALTSLRTCVISKLPSIPPCAGNNADRARNTHTHQHPELRSDSALGPAGRRCAFPGMWRRAVRCCCCCLLLMLLRDDDMRWRDAVGVAGACAEGRGCIRGECVV